MSDPLDDRDDDAREVADKRVLEQLDAEGELAQLAQLLTDENVRDYLWRLIGRCGTLNEAWDPNYGKVSYNCGRQSIGRMLIADINLAAPRAWLEMQLKAGELTAKKQRSEVLKQLRKGRST